MRGSDVAENQQPESKPNPRKCWTLLVRNGLLRPDALMLNKGDCFRIDQQGELILPPSGLGERAHMVARCFIRSGFQMWLGKVLRWCLKCLMIFCLKLDGRCSDEKHLFREKAPLGDVIGIYLQGEASLFMWRAFIIKIQHVHACAARIQLVSVVFFSNGGSERIRLTIHTYCSITLSREERCDLLSGNSTVASRSCHSGRVTTSETKKREASEDKRRSERIRTEMAEMRPWLDVIKEEERTDGNVEEKGSVSFKIALITDALALEQLLVKGDEQLCPAWSLLQQPQTGPKLLLH